ncbi:MAG TPA: DNA-formamidopyrimidine glycosylase family protein [Polyangiaceae bacterium]|nr:DNA-formamidopyrimidine glycosylase family protein [Polyangiaceae bacterium]
MPEGDTLHGWARAIDAALRDKTLQRALSTRADLGRLEGHRVVSASARGKQLLIEFDEGHVLRTHLRMHGTIRVRDGTYGGPLTNPHVRWLLATEDKIVLCLDAPSVELLRRGELHRHPVLSRLGPDVLAPVLDSAEILRRLRAHPEQPIGAALLDQELLAGIGNVYKSELLFMTRISPFQPLGGVADARLQEIVDLARTWMRRNVGERRRTTPEGRVASRHWVYGRSGEPCLKCGARIQMQRQGPLARSTYYCPECQRQ